MSERQVCSAGSTDETVGAVALAPIVDTAYLRGIGPRVLVSMPRAAAWTMPALERLAELCALPANWDSYGAEPVRVEVAKGVIELLNQLLDAGTQVPYIVPTNRGGIQLEWHTAEADLEVSVDRPPRFSFELHDAHAGQLDEDEDSLDFDRLAAHLSRFPAQ
jgi:hypothetical protein